MSSNSDEAEQQKLHEDFVEEKQFDLLCEDGHLVKNSISIQMLGVLIGAMISGQLSDRYGRKTKLIQGDNYSNNSEVLIASLLGVSVFSLGTALAFTFVQFTVLRAVVGIFTGGLSAVQGVFLIENIPKHHRMWINTIVTWSPNFIIYPVIAYWCHDWRKLSMFTAAIGVVATVNLCCLHESPRWLIHHGRIDRARLVLAHIRKLNRKTCEKEAEEIEAMLMHEQSIIRWGVNIMVGVGDYFCKRVGRKLINFVAITFIMGALAIICGLYLQDLQIKEAWVIRYCTIGVTAMTSQLYIAKFMITNELFPTAVRNIAVSALSVASRLGTIIAPQLFYLADVLPVLPYMVLLVLSFIDCISFHFFLPETKGTNLENHLPPKDQKIFYRKQSVLEE
ncbi:transporter, major facilitator family protein [Ancylostoma ceylanicum]|uniref:Transporter, major facilitator family protein n=1 Tax=Ancylostoma ceylanicum TaxID=53326 RepID=A0A0D6LS88_9BILA|nr:transporter, major facilitator family protein [Ancylostoma ceylanicum]